MIRFGWGKAFLWNLLVTLFLPAFLLAAVLPSGRRGRFVWGSMPLISNKYWSAAVGALGHDSVTVMHNHFGINQRSDFDLYFEDYAPSILPLTVRRGLGTCLGLVAALRTTRVVHLSFMGFALNSSWLWRMEAPLFHLAGAKIVAMPFGGDFYRLSKVIDTSMRHVLLESYPNLVDEEPALDQRVAYWVKHADAVLCGMQVDAMARWDVALNQFFHIDTDAWPAVSDYSPNDGRNGRVRILHTPNHRAFKGSEFVVKAVEQLKDEGLDVELVLLEQVPNDVVREEMQRVDILAEQFIATGYALNAIEGMASGLPVLANLEHEAYTRLFRRYSFLDECPVLSTTPETLTENLRLLVTNPELRAELGRASRQFAEKYHSLAAARYLFGKIYERILDDRDIDLINLFHPLKSEYSRRIPRVSHPLVENHLPPDSPYCP